MLAPRRMGRGELDPNGFGISCQRGSMWGIRAFTPCLLLFICIPGSAGQNASHIISSQPPSPPPPHPLLSSLWVKGPAAMGSFWELSAAYVQNKLGPVATPSAGSQGKDGMGSPARADPNVIQKKGQNPVTRDIKFLKNKLVIYPKATDCLVSPLGPFPPFSPTQPSI